MKIFPIPTEIQKRDYNWDQLVLGVNSLNRKREIIEDFWSIIIRKLKKVKEIDIHDPNEKAWFHLRRVDHNNSDYPSIKQLADNRIEIFRLKRGFISKNIQEELRKVFQKENDIICAGWWPVKLNDETDNEFHSFLQKISILRIQDKIIHNKYLGYIIDRYDRCQYCQEAYNVMMTSNSRWTNALTPWFNYMRITKMKKNKTHEYAHWFGHIISGWP